MAERSLQARVDEFPWWHTIDLGHGVVTPGRDQSPTKLEWLHLPERLDGRRVIDICTFNGFFAFETERRGAARVVATDSYAWQHPFWRARGAFDLAAAALDSQVEAVELDVLEHTEARLGTFDLVLFLGVLYHMRHPLLALERVAEVTRGLLVLETLVDMLGSRRPAAAYYPGSSQGGDATNFWGPNVEAVAAMLEDAGFTDVRVVYTTPIAERARAAMGTLRARSNPLPRLGQGRAVFHATKA